MTRNDGHEVEKQLSEQIKTPEAPLEGSMGPRGVCYSHPRRALEE